MLPDPDPILDPQELDPAAVKRSMARIRGAMKRCYEREIKDDATLGGKLTMSWVINAEGRAEDIGVAGNATGSGDPSARKRIRCLQRHRSAGRSAPSAAEAARSSRPSCPCPLARRLSAPPSSGTFLSHFFSPGRRRRSPRQFQA